MEAGLVAVAPDSSLALATPDVEVRKDGRQYAKRKSVQILLSVWQATPAAEAVAVVEVAVVEVVLSEDGNFLTYFKSKQGHCQPVSIDYLSSFAPTCMVELLATTHLSLVPEIPQKNSWIAHPQVFQKDQIIFPPTPSGIMYTLKLWLCMAYGWDFDSFVNFKTRWFWTAFFLKGCPFLETTLYLSNNVNNDVFQRCMRPLTQHKDPKQRLTRKSPKAIIH